MKDQFYLTLLSDSSMDIFPRNSQCCFKVKLPQPISMEKQMWEVALVELIVPAQPTNIPLDESSFYVKVTHQEWIKRFHDKMTKHDHHEAVTTSSGRTYYKDHKIDKDGNLVVRLNIPPGNYSSPRHLTRTINDVFEEKCKVMIQSEKANIGITYSEHAKRVKVNFREHVKIQFSDGLYKRLGGDPTQQSSRYIEKEIFPYGVDLNMGINHLYIYSDIIEYNMVGHIQAPLLRIVPFKTSSSSDIDNGNQYQHQEFLNLHYLPIAKSEFDTIHINISGDAGEPIQFATGKSMVKLHFRRRQRQLF